MSDQPEHVRREHVRRIEETACRILARLEPGTRWVPANPKGELLEALEPTKHLLERSA
jgi:hypothetical protein